MEQPSQRPTHRKGESETEEIDREMAILEREGGGAAESAPIGRLVRIVIPLVVVLAVLWYLLR